MWNPLKKKAKTEEEKTESNIPGLPDKKDMNMLQRFAMKRLERMSPGEREKLMKKAMTPKNIQKHKGEILASLDAMKASGQLSDDQYRLARKRFNI